MWTNRAWTNQDFTPGMRVRVTNSIEFGTRARETVSVEGVVIRFGEQKSGSWYAHSPDGKVWVDRLELRKADGELVKVNLDRNSQVEVLEEGAAA